MTGYSVVDATTLATRELGLIDTSKITGSIPSARHVADSIRRICERLESEGSVRWLVAIEEYDSYSNIKVFFFFFFFFFSGPIRC